MSDREVAGSLRVSRARPGNLRRKGTAPLYVNGSPLRLGVRGYAIICCVYPPLLQVLCHAREGALREKETCWHTRMTFASVSFATTPYGEATVVAPAFRRHEE